MKFQLFESNLMVSRPGTMIFGISIKKCFRKMDSIQKMMHSASVNAENNDLSNAQQAASPPARLHRALHGFSLLQRKGGRPLWKEGGTLANFYIGVEMYWLASCVASADGAVVVIRPSSKAKINEKSMKN